MAAAIKVDRDVARMRLDLLWEKLDDATPVALPDAVRDKVTEVINSDAVAFRYILVTGLLGKLVNPSVHPRCIQAKSKLKGAYDARTLCHKVVVPFEKTKGYLFGMSNEPIVGKAARHPEHSKDNAQLKNKDLAAATHDALDYAHTAPPEQVEAMLRLALKLGRERGKSQVLAIEKVDANLEAISKFVAKILVDGDGGSRLQAVVGAFLTLLNPSFKVTVNPATAADQVDNKLKRVGDVEIFSKKRLVAAYECKDQPIKLIDIDHGVRKARTKGVQEYVFITTGGFEQGKENEIRDKVAGLASERDVAVFTLADVVRLWAVALNPVRRAAFGPLVAEILRSKLKRDTSANAVATAWNSLE